jgi:hypothetical protein
VLEDDRCQSISVSGGNQGTFLRRHSGAQPCSHYAIPEQADVNRVPPQGRFAAWVKDEPGRWKRLTKGLPHLAYFGTYREGMAADGEDPTGVYFGTNTGQLYATRDAGENWLRIADSLPPILSVSPGSVG